MRIFVFSDTHGDTTGMDLVISRAAPDMIIHCGDGADDAAEIHQKYPNIEMYIVRGNSDKYFDVEQEKYLHIMGHTIYYTHGDTFNHGKGVTRSDSESEIVRYARQHGADIVLHGHTHIAMFSFENGVYLMNPGSASLKKPNDYRPSFGCIELFEGNVIVKILSVEVFEILTPVQVAQNFMQ